MTLGRIARIAVPLGIAAIAAGVVLSARPAAAATDLSGDWSLSYALSCSATITQTGSDLSAAVDCGADIQVTLTGTFTPASGAFSLAGEFVSFPVNVAGSVSSDGGSLHGIWSAPPVVSEGPFSAARSGGGSATDLTGSWGIVVENIFSGSCSVALQQDGAQLTAETQCEGGPAGTFTGSFDEAAGTFTISGPFGQFTSLALSGAVSDDGNSFDGTWFIDPVGPGGVITGERIGGGPTETPTRVRPQATPTTSITLPRTGGGASGGGTAGWLYGAIAGALALSAASYLALRRAR